MKHLTLWLALLAPSCVVATTQIPDLAAAEASSIAQFERLKALEGDWVGTANDGTQTFPVETSWHVTAGGHAVAEALFVGTPHEMVSLYHRDGPYLMLTHYCAAGNQPRMRAMYFSPPAPSSGCCAIEFDYLDATNMQSADDLHMGHLRLMLDSDTALRAEWTAFVNGKPDHTASFAMMRKP